MNIKIINFKILSFVFIILSLTFINYGNSNTLETNNYSLINTNDNIEYLYKEDSSTSNRINFSYDNVCGEVDLSSSCLFGADSQRLISLDKEIDASKTMSFQIELYHSFSYNIIEIINLDNFLFENNRYTYESDIVEVQSLINNDISELEFIFTLEYSDNSKNDINIYFDRVNIITGTLTDSSIDFWKFGLSFVSLYTENNEYYSDDIENDFQTSVIYQDNGVEGNLIIDYSDWINKKALNQISKVYLVDLNDNKNKIELNLTNENNGILTFYINENILVKDTDYSINILAEQYNINTKSIEQHEFTLSDFYLDNWENYIEQENILISLDWIDRNSVNVNIDASAFKNSHSIINSIELINKDHNINLDLFSFPNNDFIFNTLLDNLFVESDYYISVNYLNNNEKKEITKTFKIEGDYINPEDIDFTYFFNKESLVLKLNTSPSTDSKIVGFYINDINIKPSFISDNDSDYILITFSKDVLDTYQITKNKINKIRVDYTTDQLGTVKSIEKTIDNSLVNENSNNSNKTWVSIISFIILILLFLFVSYFIKKELY